MKSINLNTTQQKDLYKEACRHMAECIPDWQDLYPGDPAVAILEYMTYLSNIQNQHLDRILPGHLEAYLRLLGGKRKTAKPAELLAVGDSPCHLGQRFLMGGIPFEVHECFDQSLPQVKEVVFHHGSGNYTLQKGTDLKLPGGKDGAFRIRLTDELPVGRKLRFWFQIVPEKGRNLPLDETVPPVKILAATGSRTAECIDHTCGFLRSGMIEITPQEPADELMLHIHGLWEGRPRLRNVILEPVGLSQKQTRSTFADLSTPFRLPQGWNQNLVYTFFSREGTGWRQEKGFQSVDGYVTGWTGPEPEKIRVVAMEPDFVGAFSLKGIAMERILMEEAGICPESLRVMIEQNGVWYDCPLCEPEKEKTILRGCRWEALKNSLYFGDERDYLVPDPGTVLICGCVITRGAKVNGAFGELLGEDSHLQCLTDAQNGVTEESLEEAFSRTMQESQKSCRAVTCQDYEFHARQTPGLAMDRIRAVPQSMLGKKGPGVVVLAKPRSEEDRPSLTLWQKEQLFHQLNSVGMIGVPVEIRSARYCSLCVRVSIISSEAIAEETLRQAAVKLTDGLEGDLDFGAEVSYTALYGALGSVPHVRAIRWLKLIPLSGGVRRSQDGSIHLAPDQLPCLVKFQLVDEGGLKEG